MYALIDGDVLAYRAGFATEKTKYLTSQGTVINNGPATFVEYFDDAVSAKKWADERVGAFIWSRKEIQDEAQALMIVDVMIRDILARFAEMPARIFLSGVGNFRNAIATRATYKGNREGVAKPKHFTAIRNHMVSAWGAEVSAGEEADDLMAIDATKHPGSIICTIDKDLLQVPGKHYNFVTKEEQVVSPKEGSLNFFAQVLSGDATDNVPGVAGIGPVKARKILEGAKNPRECWIRILDVYKDAYQDKGEEYAIETARLVYMRRTEGEMWNVPAEAPKALEGEKTSGKGRVPKRARSGNSSGLKSEGGQV